MKTLTEAQIAYFAGFFDGEGCVRVYSRAAKKATRSPRHVLVISVVQRFDRKLPLEMLYDAFGGWLGVSVRRRRTTGGRITNPSFQWRADNERAAKALELMLPYLTVKQAGALSGIAFWQWTEAMRLCRKHATKLSAFEIEGNDKFVDLFRVLNRCGDAIPESELPILQ